MDPFARAEGGAVINAAIDRCHHVALTPNSQRVVYLNAMGGVREFNLDRDGDFLTGSDPSFDLVRQILKEYREQLPSGCGLSVTSDVPHASGLGTSASVAVAAIGALRNWLDLPVVAEAVAREAYELEVHKLGWRGGKQDQWAAAYGGVAHYRFGPGDDVERQSLAEYHDQLIALNEWIVLGYTGGSHRSSDLQKALQDGMVNVKTSQLALRKIAELAHEAVPLIRDSAFVELGALAASAWEAKKQSNPKVTTHRIDRIYDAACSAGALGGKLVGAGGAGYFYFICPPARRDEVIRSLRRLAVVPMPFRFLTDGLSVSRKLAE